jgi:hypothetical protein
MFDVDQSRCGVDDTAAEYGERVGHGRRARSFNGSRRAVGGPGRSAGRAPAGASLLRDDRGRRGREDAPRPAMMSGGDLRRSQGLTMRRYEYSAQEKRIAQPLQRRPTPVARPDDAALRVLCAGEEDRAAAAQG